MSNERGKIVGREAFMQHIATRLGRKEPLKVAPEQPVRGVPEHYEAMNLPQEQQIDLFMQNWTALSGKVLLVKKEEAGPAIQAYVQEICREWNVEQAAMWDMESLHQLGIEQALTEIGTKLVPWRAIPASAPYLKNGDYTKITPLLQAAEQSRLGIVWADYAIANTGSIALLAHGERGRSVSLLTEILLAVFHADQLVTRMGEALKDMNQKYTDPTQLPSSINWITGPSRSADIENDLTIGIHGPGKVYAVILI